MLISPEQAITVNISWRSRIFWQEPIPQRPDRQCLQSDQLQGPATAVLRTSVQTIERRGVGTSSVRERTCRHAHKQMFVGCVLIRARPTTLRVRASTTPSKRSSAATEVGKGLQVRPPSKDAILQQGAEQKAAATLSPRLNHHGVFQPIQAVCIEQNHAFDAKQECCAAVCGVQE